LALAAEPTPALETDVPSAAMRHRAFSPRHMKENSGVPYRLSPLIAATLLAIAAPVHAASNPDPTRAPAGNYIVHPQHAHLIVSIEHLGFSHFMFRFDKINAHFNYDPAKPEATKVYVDIDTNSFSSGTPASDQRFKGDHVLNVAKFPKITYVIDEIHRKDPRHGTIAGDLTLKGVTKRVTLNTIFDGWGPGPGLEERFMKMGFSASGTLKRSDFGFDILPTMIGDEFNVAVEIEFTKAEG
jgi:polyisoprenoid-binding protein YceI